VIDGLVEFLLARYDEDQARLRKLLAGAQQARAMIKEQQMQLLGRLVPGWALWPDVEQTVTAALAVVDVHRRILDRHRGVAYPNPGDTPVDLACTGDGRPHYPDECFELRLLALPYVTHPDFEQRWLP